MIGSIFVFGLLGITCAAALLRPHYGMLGYYAFTFLMPEWNWRWSIPADLPYQKYIVAATAIGLLLSGFQGNRFSKSIGASCAALLAFLALAYLSASRSIAPDMTAWYMESLWKMVLLAVVSVRVFDTPAKVQSLIWVVIIAHTYNSFQINLDYFQTGQSRFVYRDWGFRGDNNVYSILTVPIFALTASVLLNSRLWYVTAVSAVACSLQAHQIMLMESRGCMLGCVIVLMVLVWGMPRNIRNIGIVLAGFLIVLVLAGPRVVNEFSSSFSTEENLDSSATSRFGLWKAGLEITLDYPLLGVGPKAGDTLVPQYMTGINMDSKALHNLIFEISTGIGIPALVLYLVFFAIPVALALSIIKRERSQLSSWESTAFLGVSSGIIGYWVSSMFSSGALLESSYVLAAIGLASISIRIQQKADEAMQVDEEALAPEHDIEPFPS